MIGALETTSVVGLDGNAPEEEPGVSICVVVEIEVPKVPRDRVGKDTSAHIGYLDTASSFFLFYA